MLILPHNNQSLSRSERLLRELEKLPFDLHLTGSRYFFDDLDYDSQHDWDFFTADTSEASIWANDVVNNGQFGGECAVLLWARVCDGKALFKASDQRYGSPDTIKVIRIGGEYQIIESHICDIQIVDSVPWKATTQQTMKDLFIHLDGRGNPQDKEEMRKLWRFAYELTWVVPDWEIGGLK